MSYEIEEPKVIEHRNSDAIREFNRRLGNASNITKGLTAGQKFTVYIDIDGDMLPPEKILEVTIPEDVPANCVVDASVSLGLFCHQQEQ